ncbi:hypothetical protein C0J52_15969 [Blattella germanica]|nr:hypothetical protein C0J52_15969 [Blattella germanica]
MKFVLVNRNKQNWTFFGIRIVFPSKRTSAVPYVLSELILLVQITRKRISKGKDNLSKSYNNDGHMSVFALDVSVDNEHDQAMQPVYCFLTFRVNRNTEYNVLENYYNQDKFSECHAKEERLRSLIINQRDVNNQQYPINIPAIDSRRHCENFNYLHPVWHI